MIKFLFENWEFTATILLTIVLPIIINLIPSEKPVKGYLKLLLVAITKLMEDKSKIKDIKGKNITHQEIKAIEKLKNDPKLLKRFKLFK